MNGLADGPIFWLVRPSPMREQQHFWSAAKLINGPGTVFQLFVSYHSLFAALRRVFFALYNVGILLVAFQNW